MATNTITIVGSTTPITLTLGTSGPQGIPGAGVPVGGSTGQILSKNSATNYDTGWIDNFTSDVRQTVKNDSGGTLAKGTVVYVSGANGTNVLVKAALANADSTSATTLGLLYQQLASNGTGYVITEGLLTGLNTASATAGDPVWLSGTVAGGLIYGWANEPKAPTHIVYLGTVARAHATLGEILVQVRNGWELDELHNVLITSPTNGQVLTYNSASGLWVNSSETGDISAVSVTSPITGGGTSGNVTIGIQDGTTAQKGAVQLTDSVASTSTTTAATPASVKTSYDLAAAAAPKTTTLTAGTGLTGGGTLAADRTFTLDPAVVSYDASSSLRSLPLYNEKDAAEKLLAQAVWWIDAAHSSASGQTITNLGWGGSALNATAGSSGSADSNDPKFLDWTGTNYVYLTGSANNWMSVPDAANLDITGDIDLRAYVAMDDWTPAAASMLLSKWNFGTQKSYRMFITSAGTVQLDWTSDGSTDLSAISTVATGVTDGSAKWVRATLDVDNGASGRDIKFWTSDDGSTWTQLGTTVTQAGVTSIFAGTMDLGIGATVGTSANTAAKVYRAQVLDGIGGTAILNVDTSVITSGAATSFTALTGQTVTINRATSGRKTCVVTNPLWLFGTDDYMEVADNDLVDFALTDSFTVVAIMRQWATQPSRVIVGKGQNLGTAAGYAIYSTSTNDQFMVADGTNQSFKGSAFTAGALMTVAGIRDVVADTVASNVNGTITSGTDVTTATSANASPLRVGRDSGSVYADVEGIAFAVFRRVLTTTEIALIQSYYTNRVA